MYLPICEVCANKDMIIQIRGSREQFYCSERKEKCPGFEREKVVE